MVVEAAAAPAVARRTTRHTEPIRPHQRLRARRIPRQSQSLSAGRASNAHDPRIPTRVCPRYSRCLTGQFSNSVERLFTAVFWSDNPQARYVAIHATTAPKVPPVDGYAPAISIADEQPPNDAQAQVSSPSDIRCCGRPIASIARQADARSEKEPAPRAASPARSAHQPRRMTRSLSMWIPKNKHERVATIRVAGRPPPSCIRSCRVLLCSSFQRTNAFTTSSETSRGCRLGKTVCRRHADATQTSRFRKADQCSELVSPGTGVGRSEADPHAPCPS